MSFKDWNDQQYTQFHDDAFIGIFNREDFRGLTEDDIAYAEELFEDGWLNMNISQAERQAARLDFSDIMGYEYDDNPNSPAYGSPRGFDWATFRDVYDGANS
jgi:hypothetical protein